MPSFVWVKEYTRAGLPHLHITINQYVPQGWIQKHWQRLTGAWNVDIREIGEPENAAHYLGKYLLKSVCETADQGPTTAAVLPKNSRLYGSSQDMPMRAPIESSGEWELVKDARDVGALWSGVDRDPVNAKGTEETAPFRRPAAPGPGLGPGPSPSLSEALESPDVEAPEAEDVGNDVSRSRGPST